MNWRWKKNFKKSFILIFFMFSIGYQNKRQNYPENGQCVDLLNNCDQYAANNYCEENTLKNYMQQACSKSCGFCDVTSNSQPYVFQTVEVNKVSDGPSIATPNDNSFSIEQTFQPDNAVSSSYPLNLEYTVKIDPNCLAVLNNGSPSDIEKIYSRLPNTCFDLKPKSDANATKTANNDTNSDKDDDDEEEEDNYDVNTGSVRQHLNENSGSEIHSTQTDHSKLPKNRQVSFKINAQENDEDDDEDHEEEDEHILRN